MIPWLSTRLCRNFVEGIAKGVRSIKAPVPLSNCDRIRVEITRESKKISGLLEVATDVLLPATMCWGRATVMQLPRTIQKCGIATNFAKS